MALRLPFLGRRQSVPSKPAKQFDGTPKPIDQLFAELYGSTANGRVTRSQALSVPAVLRGRNLLCSISTLPLELVDKQNRQVTQGSAASLLEQFDPDVANVVHIAQTIEDLIFESIAWWRITAFGWDGYPVNVRRLDPCTVTLNPPLDRSPAYLPGGIDPRGKERVVWVDGRSVPFAEIIRFDSPNPPVLQAGASAIRRAILLDQAAKVFAENPPPGDYFQPGESTPEMDDKKIERFLTDWKAARRRRTTAWVPMDVKYESVSSPSPRELQLRELQQQASIEIANMLGLDPEELGVSTTSRTYANVVDRRKDKINDVLSPYMKAITDRLSMRDVTKPSLKVRFDLDDYLKPNAAERWANHKIAKEIGVLDAEEIRAKEGEPPGAPEPEQQTAPAPPSDTEPAEPAVDNSADATTASGGSGRYQFDAERRTYQFDVPLHRFKVDADRRIVEGLILPYGETANKYGFKFRFARGSLSYSETSRVKLTRDHGEAVGVALNLADRKDGMYGRFKVGRGAAGDELLALAEDGVYDGLSVGVDFDINTDASPDSKDESVLVINRAVLREVALTALPAFDSARVAKVAASQTQEDVVPDTNPAPAPQPEPTPAAVPAQPTVQLLTDINADDNPPEMIKLSLNGSAPIEFVRATPPEYRELVNPTRPVGTLQVSEPASYRFSRGRDGKPMLVPAAHDFGIDFVRAVHPQFGGGRPDTPEYRRVMALINAQFNTISTDVNELNPTINVPRYVDEREFNYPIWNAVNRGAPPNGIQPFQWPKFFAVTGYVGNHTEGVEPTSGTYITTSQSVTPTPLSGKAKITRETWDMGGTPGLSDILWRRINREWYENLEAAIVTLLDNDSPTSLGTFTVGGGTGHATLVSEMRRYLALLQFARGGFRFDVAFAEAGLYTHLSDAIDTTGRVLLPQVNPQNADGDAAARWATLNVGGVPFHPAWALGATVGTAPDSSYLIDSTAVDAWATPPQRLTFDMTEIAFVYLGVWGYKATAINDLAGVREIIYDPA